MKRQYLSPNTEIAKFNTEAIAADPTIPIGSGPAHGGDAMAKPGTGTFEDDNADDAAASGHRNLWEGE